MPLETEYLVEDLPLKIGNNILPFSGTVVLTECDPEEYLGEFYVSNVIGFDTPAPQQSQTMSQQCWKMVADQVEKLPEAAQFWADFLQEEGVRV